jgi:hypothetical protein
LEYGRGDVRHFSEDDAVAVPGLQNPTRQLAERDNKLALKLNEVVADVNNKEQYVPLPILRTAVSPGVEEIVTNFRIPVGFEARVLNAAVASTPSGTDLALKIFYNTTFGGSTGTELVSVTDEFTSGTAFYNDGEFIVSIRNNGAASLEAVASVTLTVRPIAERGSLLVGSVIQGDKGDRGEKGDKGEKGDPGTGAPSVAIVWKGNYSGASPYVPGDAVYYATSASSYLNRVASTGVVPTNASYWDILALGGGAGSGLTWLGTFTSTTWSTTGPGALGCVVNDIVGYNDGSSVSSYICILGVGSSPLPDSVAGATYWDLMVSGASVTGGETPTYEANDLSSTSYFFATGTVTTRDMSYAEVNAASFPTYLSNEFVVSNTSGSPPNGIAMFHAFSNLNMAPASSGTFVLPISLHDSAQWTNVNTALNVSAHGTRIVEWGTHVGLVDVLRVSTGTWILNCLSPVETVHVSVQLQGFRSV